MSNQGPLWSQSGHAIRCEWGPQGAARVAGAGGAVVIVDVLSFTTSVSVAVERGTAVIPAAWRDERATDLADREGAVLAVGRREVTDAHPWSLSPAALRRAPSPERLVLPSPNGSAIAATTSGVVVAACFRNASAVASWLRENGYGSGSSSIALVPAGERWPDGSLRPALEDLLGAGAVLHALVGGPDTRLSPEAEAARALYGATRSRLAEAVRGSGSGVELINGGFSNDVEIALEIDACAAVPLLAAGRFTDATA